MSGGWDGDCDRELHRGQFDLHSFHMQQASGNQDQVQFGSWNLNSDSNVGMTISSIPSTSWLVYTCVHKCIICLHACTCVCTRE